MNKIIENALNSKNKVNMNQIMFDVIKDETDKLGRKPKLLLHACCAVCTSIGIEVLNDIVDLSVFFYNPNIHPKVEYERRRLAQVNFIDEYNRDMGTNIEMITLKYDSMDFFKKAKEFALEPEGGLRCNICYQLRLEVAAKYAKEHGFDYFGTAITLSPMKHADRVNKEGFRAAEKHGIPYLPSDFKKDQGNLRAKNICIKYNVYRQNFCGCVYARMQQKIDIREVIKNAKASKNG